MGVRAGWQGEKPGTLGVCSGDEQLLAHKKEPSQKGGRGQVKDNGLCENFAPG